MQITLEALENAVAPIEELGQGESTFSVGSTSITVHALLPEEEAEVQNYASQSLGEESSPLDYIERFKKSVLAYAIVEIGGQDLRDVTTLETAEKLDNGKFVRIPKVDAMRQIVGKWTGSVRTGVFRKYIDLVSRIEDRARQAILFDPTDRDSEINRLTKDIAKLEERKAALIEERDHAGVDLSTQLAKTARTIEKMDQQVKAPDGTESDEPPDQILPVSKRTQEAPVSGRRQSIVPQQGAPPVTAPAPRVTREATAEVAPAPAPEPAPTRVNPEFEDSFVDPGDQESMAAAIAAETRRVLARRQQQQQAAPVSVINAALARRPPHLDAQETEDELETASTARGAVYAGKTADGVDTFRMPTEDLVERRGGANPQQRVPLNKGQDPKVSRNPRFKPAPRM
jgi:hypothetical protein